MRIELTDGEAFDMPAWQDCTWRRVPCGERTCPMCGRVLASRQKAISQGLDPDSMESALMGVEDSFQETYELLAKGLREQGLDPDNLPEVEMPEPPEPSTYPLFNELMEWRASVYQCVGTAEEWGEAWLKSEAGQDLAWYANSLPIKTARLLRARWLMENESRHNDLDYKYTQYVVGEVVEILKRALSELRRGDTTQTLPLQMLHSKLMVLEPEIRRV